MYVFSLDAPSPGWHGQTCLPVGSRLTRLGRMSTVKRVWRCHPANGALHAKHVPQDIASLHAAPAVGVVRDGEPDSIQRRLVQRVQAHDGLVHEHPPAGEGIGRCIDASALWGHNRRTTCSVAAIRNPRRPPSRSVRCPMGSASWFFYLLLGLGLPEETSRRAYLEGEETRLSFLLLRGASPRAGTWAGPACSCQIQTAGFGGTIGPPGSFFRKPLAFARTRWPTPFLSKVQSSGKLR